MNKTKPIFRSSFYFERTKKTPGRSVKKSAESSNQKKCVQKKGKSIVVPNKIWKMSIFFKLFFGGHDRGIPRYESRVAGEKQVIRDIKLKVTIYIV